MNPLTQQLAKIREEAETLIRDELDSLVHSGYEGSWSESEIASAVKRLSSSALTSSKSMLETVDKLIKDMNVPIPCGCPKGGLVGDNEVPCDECGGSEWTKRHVCRFNDGEQNCECYQAALSSVSTLLREAIKEIK